MRVADRFSVLVVDDAHCPLGSMALSLTRIGIDPVYANDEDEALLLAQQEGQRLGAVCFPAELGVEHIDPLVKRVAERVGLAGASMIPVGDRPDREALTALRERGIRWALWGGYDDADLRFVLAHVIEQICPDDLRAEPRVPAGRLEARLYKGAVARPARLVDLSVGGAFLETDRPLPEASGVSLEIDLPDASVRLRARVCWTRRDPHPEREDLSIGMGVEFTGEDAARTQQVRRYVKSRMARFVVSVGSDAQADPI